MRTRTIVVTLLAAGALAACERPEPADAPAPASDMSDGAAAVVPAVEYYDDGTGIRWVRGDVDAAFALARAEGKPVLLYWGAEWCPPCHLIKATVFNKREFVERSRLFVPVYLDGDTDRAQRQAERFGVLGYPTVIVFTADGTELTRIASGIDVEAYAGVLDAAIASMRPVREITLAALRGEPPAPGECRLLAYYSWDQDNERILTDLDPATLYRSLLDRCGADRPVEASRLSVLYVRALAAAAGSGDTPVPLTAAQRQEGTARLHAILDAPALVRANSYDLLFEGAGMTAALTEAGTAEREALVGKFHAALERLADDERAYANERLYTGYAKVRFERIDEETAPVSEALKAEIRDRVAWADRSTTDVYERQTVMNAAWNTMFEAGLDAEANAMLMAEIERSKEPYYFMLSLAELAQRAGHTEEALAWLRRAYEEARGPATRFQWGYNYIVGLIEMAPDDAATIERETLRVFGELEEDAADAFYQRTKQRMQQLERKFLEWNAAGAHAATLASIRNGVLGICATIPPAEESRANCESFLASLGAAG